MSPAVRQHLEEILALVETHSINRYRIEWPAFRREVWSAAPGARTLAEAEPALLRVLELLGDGHSFYQSARPDRGLAPPSLLGDDRSRAPATVPARLNVFEPCAQPPAPVPAVPGNIGYVRVPGSSRPPEQDAEEILRQIREADRDGLLGWIVDLRGNRGGNMWPMLVGIGPVLGEGTAGHFVDADGNRRAWGYVGGAAVLDGAPQIRVAAPYALRRPARRVAVLTDQATVSSGEAIVVAFRRRGGARSFGQPTCGRSTANRPFRVGNGAVLFLTVGIMADRDGTVYGGPIEPDERATGAESVRRAVEWLTLPAR